MSRCAGLLAALAALAAISPAQAAGPVPALSSYVNEDGADVFVARFGADLALELDGCATPADARETLGLSADHLPETSTFDTLETAFALSSRPRLPCAGAAFDAAWPATAPVWADVEETGLYFLAAPDGDGHYALPAACTALRDNLALRERLQLPGVLQGIGAPEGADTALMLGCGTKGGADQPASGPASNTGFTLHSFFTFLSEASTGDTILVVRQQPEPGGAEPAFLAIQQVNGRPVAEVLLEGGAEADAMTAALRDLFGLPADAPITAVPSAERAAIMRAVFADLCLEGCLGYPHASRIFDVPGALALTGPVTLAADVARDRLGARRLDWRFADGRGVSFEGCDTLVTALGLQAGPEPEWNEAVEAALAENDALPRFDCRAVMSGLCRRQISEGGMLDAAALNGAGCEGARGLRIELPQSALAPAALNLAGLPFDWIELRPRAGLDRAQLRVIPSAAPQGTCFTSDADVLIALRGAPEVRLTRIDLLRDAASTGGEVIGIQSEDAVLRLDDARIGPVAAEGAPLSRAVALCGSQMYAGGGALRAEAIGLQAVGAQVLAAGRPDARLRISDAQFGMYLTAGSAVRLHQTDVSAATGGDLRDAALIGSSVALAARDASGAGNALRLHHGSAADLTGATIAGFRCVASFLDAASAVRLLLPGNDTEGDNAFLSCGPGQMTVLE